MNTDADRETVFVVDDDPAVLKAWSRVLCEEGWRVETFESAEAYLARSVGSGEGCLVLDVTLPGLDGLALQRALADARRELPIIFVTGHGDIPMSVRAMKAGAADFLTKPVPAQALVAAVRSAIDGQRSAGRERADQARLQQRYAGLTSREREVLAALAAGKLNKQIAAHLGIVEQTVKFHRARIMERMQARTVAELMHMAARLRIGEMPGPSAADAPASTQKPPERRSPTD